MVNAGRIAMLGAVAAMLAAPVTGANVPPGKEPKPKHARRTRMMKAAGRLRMRKRVRRRLARAGRKAARWGAARRP